MVNDTLSDFLTRIRNAGMARQTRIDVPASRMIKSVAELLAREGYIKGYKEVTEDNKPYLRVFVKFVEGNLQRPLIQGIKRESRPGLRKYAGKDKLPRVLSGFGLSILSTSKGVITDRDARKLGVGGELLCSVW